ncbi:MAG TPA: hypothetical protein PKL88_03070 [bacterium]|nr:hypothetical protein [bacterium]
MKLNKQQLGLLYMCVKGTIEGYTYELINEDGIKYAQLNILLSDLKKEIEK